jgi:hypothetical protein
MSEPAPEADVFEQHQDAELEEEAESAEFWQSHTQGVGHEASEADLLDQSRFAHLDDEDFARVDEEEEGTDSA